jgi:hypothetical protein
MVLDPAENFVRGATDASVASGDTTISVADASLFVDPSTEGEYNVVVWDSDTYNNPDIAFNNSATEIMRVTARDANNNNLTVTRGQENTSAISHPSGATVLHTLTAIDQQDIENTFSQFWDSSASELTADVNNSAVSTEALYTASRIYDAVVWTDGTTYYADGRSTEISSGSSFSTVFQAALDSVVTTNRDNGTVAVAKGTYSVDGLVDIREGVTVDASQGAVFEPESDSDMLRMRPDAAWHGGAVNCRNGVGFSSDVFRHEGTSSGPVMHGPRNQTPITDVFIALPDTTGTAVALRPLSEDSNHVTWTYHNRIAIYNGEYGFALDVPGTTGLTTPPYANANYFSNCVTFQTVNSVYIDAPDESAAYGNSFDAFGIQAGDNSERALEIANGDNNQFDNWMVWDWNIAAFGIAVNFASGTEGNRFDGSVNPSYANDSGSNAINGYSDVSTAPSNSARWQGKEDVAEELGILIWDTSTSPPTPYRAFNGSYIAI